MRYNKMEEKKSYYNVMEEREDSPAGLTRQILFAISEGNEVLAVRLSEEMVSKGLLGILENPVTEWQFYIVRLLTLMAVVIEKNGTGSAFLESQVELCLKQVEKLKTLDECHRLYLEIVRSCSQINKEPGKNYSPLVQRIREQVMTDLKQPLTLQFFSEQLNVNSSYLSNLFRQQTGVTITEYVTNKRITHAATLLNHTQQPIKSVAKQVGIPDVQYFSRLFKRRMGLTPTQYREKMAAGGEEKENAAAAADE